jgi:lipopolysaccharide transport system ATP-binding protein
MSQTVIRVENLYKEYKLGVISHGTLTHDLQSWWARMRGKEDPNSLISAHHSADAEKDSFLALKDVSFEVKQGDRIGIIGRNGAGKSTLLKILSKITSPTSGQVKIKGRVASLLEVGTGFHAELTGRENIYLNGAILGMSRKEIDRKLDEIIDFAGIEKHIDTPVKRYSSGMNVRLGFAIAAHLEPEILIVDEVLAVGDAEFQKKALGKMEDVSKGEGRTILFVSHNMAAVSALCNCGIILQNGSLIKDSNIKDCISSYMNSTHIQSDSNDLSNVRRINNATGDSRIVGFSIRNIDSDSDIIDSEKPCRAELIFEVLHDNLSVAGEFLITDGIQGVCLFHSYLRNGLAPVFQKGIHKLVCYTEALSLYSGSYYVTLALSRPGVPVDYIEKAIEITVELSPRDECTHEFIKIPGSMNHYVEHKWQLG